MGENEKTYEGQCWCGAVTIILLILAHLGGVIYHTFVRRDGLLKRMV